MNKNTSEGRKNSIFFPPPETGFFVSIRLTFCRGKKMGKEKKAKAKRKKERSSVREARRTEHPVSFPFTLSPFRPSHPTPIPVIPSGSYSDLSHPITQ